MNLTANQVWILVAFAIVGCLLLILACCVLVLFLILTRRSSRRSLEERRESSRHRSRSASMRTGRYYSSGSRESNRKSRTPQPNWTGYRSSHRNDGSGHRSKSKSKPRTYPQSKPRTQGTFLKQFRRKTTRQSAPGNYTNNTVPKSNSPWNRQTHREVTRQASRTARNQIQTQHSQRKLSQQRQQSPTAGGSVPATPSNIKITNVQMVPQASSEGGTGGTNREYLTVGPQRLSEQWPKISQRRK